MTDPQLVSSCQARGGVRKLRWGLSGRGKRGGLRVLYYVVHANVPAHVLNELRKVFENA